MKTILKTTVSLQIVFLISQVSQSCNAESTVTEKTTSKQTQTETTTQKSSETTKPRVTEETRQSSSLRSSQWAVTTLKNSDFTTQVSDVDSTQTSQPCKSMKVVDLIEKRKQAYERDASVIQFVSAHALPVNTSSFTESPCEAQARRNLAKKRRKPRVQEPVKVGNDTKTATKRPCREGEPEGDECDINNRMPEAGPHDYIVSSIEYYDEDQILDIKDCPNDLEIITLELEELRQYDYQCEIITKWIGLDPI